MAIGAGIIGDLWRPEERGRAAALYSAGVLLGPAIGPIGGGWIAQTLPGDGYKWVFFSTSIFCAIVQVMGVFFLKETYSPVLLLRKAKRIKVEMGLEKKSDRVKTVFEIKDGDRSPAWLIRHGLIRPFAMMYSQRILQLLSAYMCLICMFPFLHFLSPLRVLSLL